MSTREKKRWGQFLLGMGLAVRRRLTSEISKTVDGLADVVAEGGGDVIFRIDRMAEEAMRDYIAAHSGRVPPFVLIAEGYDDGHAVIGGGKPAFWVLCDPVDGSRGIMYDKRPAYFLCSVAPATGDSPPSLLDTAVSVAVELPTSKQGWADQYVAVRGEKLLATRARLGGRATRPVVVRPSTAHDLQGGFGHVADFFPGTKLLAAELMEAICAAAAGAVEPGRAKVFNDQYICTGGQMVELMLHDRFCCDLRPLFFQILKKQGVPTAEGLCCHPYDCAGALVAQQAGVLLTDGFGADLNPAYGVQESVHWCGFSNAVLRGKIEPVIQAFLAKYGVRDLPHMR